MPKREVGAHRPPHLRELHDRAGAHEHLDVLAVGLPPAEGVGHPAAREAAGEALGARGVQPRVAAVEVGRVGGHRQQQRQHAAQAVAHEHRAVGVAYADVDVHGEGVVAPRDVLQALLHAAVVLGVDDPLLAVVRPRVGPGGAQRHAVLLGEREQPAAVLALAGERVVEVRAGAGDDLDLAGDQLAGDVLVQQRVARAGGVAELFEAGHHLQRRGVQQ